MTSDFQNLFLHLNVHQHHDFFGTKIIYRGRYSSFELCILIHVKILYENFGAVTITHSRSFFTSEANRYLGRVIISMIEFLDMLA